MPSNNGADAACSVLLREHSLNMRHDSHGQRLDRRRIPEAESAFASGRSAEYQQPPVLNQRLQLVIMLEQRLHQATELEAAFSHIANVGRL